MKKELEMFLMEANEPRFGNRASPHIGSVS